MSLTVEDLVRRCRDLTEEEQTEVFNRLQLAPPRTRAEAIVQDCLALGEEVKIEVLDYLARLAEPLPKSA